VSIKDLGNGVVTKTAEQITPLGVKRSNVKLQAKGTVLLSFKLTIGRVGIAGVPVYTNEAIAGLRSDELDANYLFQGLQQWDLLQGVDQAIKGATLNKEKLRKIEFEYPTYKPEQTKIANVLSTVDRAIGQTEALIAKQQRLKTGLMQDLLTRGIDEHGNLRSEDTHGFKNSPLGRIPVEWDIHELGTVAELVTSGSRGWAQYYSDEGATFLRIGNLTRQHINLRFDDLVFVDLPESSEGKRTALRGGDLLISITADLGIIGVIPENVGEAYVNQHIALVRLLSEAVNPRFVGWYLSGRTGQSQFEKLNESGAKAGLNLPTIRKLFVPLPDTLEQEGVAEVLDLNALEMEQLGSNLRKFRSLKTALMQDLLTGKKRVTPLLEAAGEYAAERGTS
jgi:type I restriction enzyme S subunit